MAALQIIRSLIDDLNNHNINYCHWKSNQHLEASFKGDTDLDILFDSKEENKVRSILEKNNFHLFEAVWYKKYSGIVDYIGFDLIEAKTVHVHTHFDLDLGEVGVKSYHLPWDNFILKNRIYNKNFKIYTSSPDIEYLLLVVRTAFKRDTINFRSNRRIIQDFNREAKWLYPLVPLERLKLLTEQLLTTEISPLIQAIRVEEAYDKENFLELRKLLKIFFKKDRVLSGSQVNYLKFLYFLNALKKRLNKIPGINFRFPRRSLPNKGIIISLMGPDGAGKSTQTGLLTKELKKKVDVRFMYMGSGKGEKSFQRKIIDDIFDLGLKIRPEKKEESSLSGKQTGKKKNRVEIPLSKKNLLIQFILSIKAVSLAFERRSKLKIIKKEKKKGTIVICDRYPQTEYPGFNDGLKLQDNIGSKNFILRNFALYEEKCYNMANSIIPDLVIKFSGDVNILHSRRPEMEKYELEAKQKGISRLKFGNNTEIVNINIEDEVDRIKAKVLNKISSKISEMNKV